MDVCDDLVEEGLRELADKRWQRRVWLGRSTGQMSSFTECLATLFDDSGLGDALERSETVYSPAIDDLFRELDSILEGVNGWFRKPADVVRDPGMEQARELARSLLNELRAREWRHMLATLRDVPGASVEFETVDEPDVVVAECRVPNLPNIAVCFSGSTEALEWHLVIKDADTKNELWSDWLDYTGYGQADMQTLAADMQRDLELCLDDVRRATDFRTSTTRFAWMFKLHSAQWLIDGQWREVLPAGG